MSYINQKVNRKLNPPINYFGFDMVTRLRYQDENILRKEMDLNFNMYNIPKNPKVVVDIGAHIGGTSILAASMGAGVHAYEPEAYNFEILCNNVKLNGLDDKIRCYNIAVGKPGMAELFVHQKNSGATTLFKNGLKNCLDENKQIVKIISIHDVFASINHCDLLKMDCEGAETDIIRDLDEELINKIDNISVEFHNRDVFKELYSKL